MTLRIIFPDRKNWRYAGIGKKIIPRIASIFLAFEEYQFTFGIHLSYPLIVGDGYICHRPPRLIFKIISTRPNIIFYVKYYMFRVGHVYLSVTTICVFFIDSTCPFVTLHIDLYHLNMMPN